MSKKKEKEEKKKQQEEKVEALLEDKEELAVNNDDDDEEDDRYANLTDEQLLELALKDDEDETKKPTKKKDNEQPKKPRKFDRTNVLYLGHVPHGFFEHEIKAFLTQFGKVKKVRVSRNPKTGHSRGYAFIQLANEEVTKIVKKTLHGYILRGRALVCQHIPEELVHEKMFLGGLLGKNSVVNTYEGARKKRVLAHIKVSDSEESKIKRLKRLMNKDKKRRDILEKKGIKFEFVGYKDE